MNSAATPEAVHSATCIHGIAPNVICIRMEDKLRHLVLIAACVSLHVQ